MSSRVDFDFSDIDEIHEKLVVPSSLEGYPTGT